MYIHTTNITEKKNQLICRGKENYKIPHLFACYELTIDLLFQLCESVKVWGQIFAGLIKYFRSNYNYNFRVRDFHFNKLNEKIDLCMYILSMSYGYGSSLPAKGVYFLWNRFFCGRDFSIFLWLWFDFIDIFMNAQNHEFEYLIEINKKRVWLIITILQREKLWIWTNSIF